MQTIHLLRQMRHQKGECLAAARLTDADEITSAREDRPANGLHEGRREEAVFLKPSADKFLKFLAVPRNIMAITHIVERAALECGPWLCDIAFAPNLRP